MEKEIKKQYCDNCGRCVTAKNGKSHLGIAIDVPPTRDMIEVYPELELTQGEHKFCWVCLVNAFKTKCPIEKKLDK